MNPLQGLPRRYRTCFEWPHLPTDVQRRARLHEREAVLLARQMARMDDTGRTAWVLDVDPVTGTETELLRYTPENPPPDTDDDLN
ncbi:hypothetical protein [Amycolatopsis sp. NPDC059657]|uniref:hypothetical protein n=1 Tax=Amycolatopsis sp. NPDC059657 TaxID=3346899 RepID=UPI0036713509